MKNFPENNILKGTKFKTNRQEEKSEVFKYHKKKEIAKVARERFNLMISNRNLADENVHYSEDSHRNGSYKLADIIRKTAGEGRQNSDKYRNELLADDQNILKKNYREAQERIETIFITATKVLQRDKAQEELLPAEEDYDRAIYYTELVAEGLTESKKGDDQIIIADIFNDLQNLAELGDELLERAKFIREEKGSPKELGKTEQDKLVNIAYDIEQFGEFNPENLAGVSDDLHQVIVESLIEAQMFDVLEENFSIFKELSQPIVQKIIKEGKEKLVFENLQSFEDLDDSSADELIATGQINVLVKNLASFKDLNDHIANAILEAGLGLELSDHLDSFRNLSEEIAAKLIQMHKTLEVSKHIRSFQAEDHGNISSRIIEDGGICYIMEDKKKYSSVNFERQVPNYPKGANAEELLELYEWPGLGGIELIDSMRGLKDFSFKDHIKLIVEKQGKNSQRFFEAIKMVFKEGCHPDDIKRILEIARENPLGSSAGGPEVLLTRNWKK